MTRLGQGTASSGVHGVREELASPQVSHAAGGRHEPAEGGGAWGSC